MSVLLLGTSALTGALIRRLVAQGDDVRVVERDERAATEWARLGARVARGSGTDADLVARAAQGARSIVVTPPEPEELRALVATAVECARAGDAVRVILCAPRVDRTAIEVIESSGVEHVILDSGHRRGLVPRRKGARRAGIVAAIDAADDLADSPRLRLDLRDADAWRALGLGPRRH